MFWVFCLKPFRDAIDIVGTLFASTLKNRYYLSFCILMIVNGLLHDFYLARGIYHPIMRGLANVLHLEVLSFRVIVSAPEGAMVIGERLRALREQKNLSQGDIEKRTGLLRCYISRAENGHSVPAIETLEKIARAMGIPMYQLFYDGEKPPDPTPKLDDDGWGSSGRDARTLARFCRLLSRASKKDQRFLLAVAQKMSQKKTR